MDVSSIVINVTIYGSSTAIIVFSAVLAIYALWLFGFKITITQKTIEIAQGFKDKRIIQTDQIESCTPIFRRPPYLIHYSVRWYNKIEIKMFGEGGLTVINITPFKTADLDMFFEFINNRNAVAKPPQNINFI